MTGAAINMDLAEKGIAVDFLHPDAKQIDGMDAAIVGTACVYGDQPVLVYSVDRLIDELVDEHDMTYEEARDWFCNNIWCSFGGSPGDPVFIDEISRS